MNNQELQQFPIPSVPRMVIRGQHLLVLLLIAGLFALTELTGRAVIFGSFNADGIRNLLALGAAAISVQALVIQRSGRIPNLWRIWPYLLFVGWAGSSVLWTTELGYTFRDGLKLIYPILIYFLVCAFLHSAADSRRLLSNLRRVLTAFAVVTALSSAVHITLATHQGAWLWGTSRLVDTPLTVPPVIASVYVLLEIAGWQRIAGWRPRRFLVALMILYVFLSLTRAYIIGLIVAIMALFWLSRRHWSLRLMVTVVAIIGIFGLLVVDNPVKRRMFFEPSEVTAETLLRVSITNPAQFLSRDYVRLSGRFLFWDYLLLEARNRRPASIGAGLGSGRPIMRGSSFGEVTAHGDYARYLAELGYVGAGLFILVYGSLLLWSFRLAHKHSLSPVGRAVASVVFAQSVLATIVSLPYDVFWLAYDFQTLAVIFVGIVQAETYLGKARAPSYVSDRIVPSSA